MWVTLSPTLWRTASWQIHHHMTLPGLPSPIQVCARGGRRSRLGRAIANAARAAACCGCRWRAGSACGSGKALRHWPAAALPSAAGVCTARCCYAMRRFVLVLSTRSNLRLQRAACELPHCAGFWLCCVALSTWSRCRCLACDCRGHCWHKKQRKENV